MRTLVICFVASFLTLSLAAQNHWTLMGNDIYNNNSGFVGINQQTPTAHLQINSVLVDYNDQVQPPPPCVIPTLGVPALKLVGFSPDVYPAIPICEDTEGPSWSGERANIMEVYKDHGTPVRRVSIDADGRLGIGDNLDPSDDLDVAGHIRMRAGAQNGYIAVSNNVGTMSWQSPSSIGLAYWQPMTQASPGNGHIKNLDNGEVHIGNYDYSLFFDPYLGGAHYSQLSHEGDVGLFFGHTKDGEGEVNQNPGLVIASRNPNNGGRNGLRIDWDGSVCIACDDEGKYTDSTLGKYKLAVSGNILAELVRVKLYGDWPDFVFEKGYEKPTLTELETFIHKEGHLPGVPSAKEVKDNGIDLGEMNRILLQKIEELTLYVIELEKKIGENN